MLDQLPSHRIHQGPLALSALALACSLLLGACGADVGECDQKAAEELVYGDNGLVATKGQALMHDSCGNAAFCHSANAEGQNRYGAPAGMDFDMLPSPTGWKHVIDRRDDIWSSVENETMPPDGKGKKEIGDNHWVFDLVRRAESTPLPKLKTESGKAILRNWLACGAPVVTSTRVPSWALPGGGASADLSDWSGIYQTLIAPKCATAGCHDASSASAAGGLQLSNECGGYRALLAKGGCNGEARLVPGSLDSYLLDKLESSSPRCGGRMPTTGPLPSDELEAIKQWVSAGAPAKNCE